MPLVYVEFRSRLANVGVDLFHRVSVTRWTDEYPADRLLLYLGRTWRIGGEPEYLAVYYTRDSDLDRLDDWDAIFKSGDVDQLEVARLATSRIDRAGCYRFVREPVPSRGGPYYVEHFSAQDPAGGSIREAFDYRCRETDAELVLLVHRIGMLAPDPGGLAIWALQSFAGAESVGNTTTAGTQFGIIVCDAGLYHDVGAEVL